MRFHFKQIERSLTEIKQLFRTLWICALQGRIVLAPYNAWLVEQVIVDIRFLLHTQLNLVPLHTKTGLVWSISKAGGEEGSLADIYSLRSYGCGRCVGSARLRPTLMVTMTWPLKKEGHFGGVLSKK
jgi:hypothetical protein